MSIKNVNGVNLHVTDEGSGEETIVFSHGFLFSGEMFRAQVNALKDRYRCITYDHRGQGRSPVTDGGYDIETLYQDAVALIESLDVAPCHLVGLSTGGFVGIRIAARRPDLLKSLTLIETSAAAEPTDAASRYRMLAFVARWIGMRLVINRVMPIMFSKTFITDPDRAEDRAYWKDQILNGVNRPVIPKQLGGIVGRKSVVDEIEKITVPTLILVGEEDVVYPPAVAESMHGQIKGSQLVIIPHAGHTSSVEEPEAVIQAMEDFLARIY